MLRGELARMLLAAAFNINPPPHFDNALFASKNIIDSLSVYTLRGSVHFDKYGYRLLMKKFLLGLYILFNTPSK
jgi:hypothetical protein